MAAEAKVVASWSRNGSTGELAKTEMCDRSDDGLQYMFIV